MSFRLKAGYIEGAQAMMTFIASGAITAGHPVKLVAPASHGAMPKVAMITGGSGDTDMAFGIAQYGVADAAEVVVRPIYPGDVYEADSYANSAYASIGTLAGLNTSRQLVVGTSDLGRTKVKLLNVIGVAADKKYLVEFVPDAVPDMNSLYVQRLAITADATTALSFTVNETITIIDAFVEARAAAASATLRLLDASDAEISSTMLCAVDTTITRTTKIDDAKANVAKGGTVKVIAETGSVPGSARGVVTIIGIRR